MCRWLRRRRPERAVEELPVDGAPEDQLQLIQRDDPGVYIEEEVDEELSVWSLQSLVETSTI